MRRARGTDVSRRGRAPRHEYRDGPQGGPEALVMPVRYAQPAAYQASGSSCDRRSSGSVGGRHSNAPSSKKRAGGRRPLEVLLRRSWSKPGRSGAARLPGSAGRRFRRTAAWPAGKGRGSIAAGQAPRPTRFRARAERVASRDGPTAAGMRPGHICVPLLPGTRALPASDGERRTPQAGAGTVASASALKSPSIWRVCRSKKLLVMRFLRNPGMCPGIS